MNYKAQFSPNVKVVVTTLGRLGIGDWRLGDWCYALEIGDWGIGATLGGLENRCLKSEIPVN